MLPPLPQVPLRVRVVGSYLLVVAASWLGATLAADYTVSQAREDRYTSDIEACVRGNLTVRGPLSSFATSIVNEDDLTEDVHRAATALKASVAPVDCERVVNKP